MLFSSGAVYFLAGGALLLITAGLFSGCTLRGEGLFHAPKTGFAPAALGGATGIFAGAALFFVGLVKGGFAPWLCVALGVLGLSLLVFLPFSLGFVYCQNLAGFCNVAGPVFTFFGATLGRLIMLPGRLLARPKNQPAAADLTEEAVLQAVDSAEEQDVIDEDQKEMIENIFSLDEVCAGDAMTHRTEMVAIAEATPAIDVLHLAIEEGFSRMPVYSKSLDEILGILYVKDLLPLVEDETLRSTPASELCRPAMFVPESCRIRELIQLFRDKRTQIAIVVDEYGGTSGLVTMEDVLEEIVGDMQDEFDDEEELITPQGEGYLCSGSADLEDLLELFGIELEEEDAPDFDSVGGLITEQIGRIPTPGEQVEITFAGVLFRVLEAGERRILKVYCEKTAGNGNAE